MTVGGREGITLSNLELSLIQLTALLMSDKHAKHSKHGQHQVNGRIIN